MAANKNWQAIFDSWADADPSIASTGGFTAPWEFASLALEIGDHLDLDGTQRVLDVGCASGALTSLWSHRAKEVIGVDFSHRLLAAARSRTHPHNLSFVNAEAARLPFADESFDRIVCFSVLLCLPDQEYVRRSIDEIFRVARPNCRILLGSLPDISCKSVFFDHCESLAPWYRRAIPRAWRWALKRILKPGSKPGETAILWFDPEELAQTIRDAGFEAAVIPDPEYSNYAAYRKSLIVQRGEVAPLIDTPAKSVAEGFAR